MIKISMFFTPSSQTKVIVYTVKMILKDESTQDFKEATLKRGKKLELLVKERIDHPFGYRLPYFLRNLLLDILGNHACHPCGHRSCSWRTPSTVNNE